MDDKLFPCKQMDNTDGYRSGHKEVFGETDIFKNLAGDTVITVWDDPPEIDEKYFKSIIPKEKK